MKSLFYKADPYLRLFALNIFNTAFDDTDIVYNSVLLNLSNTTKDAIYTDDTYGFKDPSTLYQWTKAMNLGSNSDIYNNILTYFSQTKGLADFKHETMD